MSKALNTILVAGGLAGVLDIVHAFVFFGARGVTPGRLLQGIASGLLGARSFRYGGWTMLLGGLLHFVIAFSAAGVYYVASRRISLLTRSPILSGLLFGVLVYAFMNGVVLPLSAVVSKGPVSAAVFIDGVLALMFFVGLPISLVVSRSEPAAVRAWVAGRENATSTPRAQGYVTKQ
jgi:hypothetical protein